MSAPYRPRRRAASSLLALAVLAALLLAATLTATPAAAGVFDTGSKAVSKGSTDEQIRFWRREVDTLRATKIAPALQTLYTAQTALEKARRQQGFFYTTPEVKATIKLLDEDLRQSVVEVERLKAQENMMVAKLKPLYGVVSTHLAQDQKEAIAGAISTVQKMSYDNAWYSSLFNMDDAKSFTDVIAGFLMQWLVGYIVLYPFAVLYYAVFVAPFSIYQYMSGVSDIVPAVGMYLLSVGVMCLPLLALAVTAYMLYRKYGDRVREAMAQARASRHHHRD